MKITHEDALAAIKLLDAKYRHVEFRAEFQDPITWLPAEASLEQATFRWLADSDDSDRATVDFEEEDGSVTRYWIDGTAKIVRSALRVTPPTKSVQANLKEENTVQQEIDSVPVPEMPIVLPPGATMLKVAGKFFSEKTVELVFAELVADYRHEYFQALKHKAGPRVLTRLNAEYRGRFVWTVLREAWPAIWRVIVAIGEALRIAG